MIANNLNSKLIKVSTLLGRCTIIKLCLWQRHFNIIAKLSLNSTQLNINSNLALVPLSPATHPTGHPPTQPPEKVVSRLVQDCFKTTLMLVIHPNLNSTQTNSTQPKLTQLNLTQLNSNY